jgi:hypothetical protein
MAKGCPSAFSRKLATTILGGVPISVTSPPSRVANDSAIKVTPGARFAFAAACRSSGMSKASAATLFITAESGAAIADIRPICTGAGRSAAVNRRPS